MDAHELFDFNLRKPNQSEHDFFEECCELVDEIIKWTMIVFIPSIIILGISIILKWKSICIFALPVSTISFIAFTATYDVTNIILKIKRKFAKNIK